MQRQFTLLAALLLLLTSGASAQEMTERYIPVGAYPSLAGKYTTAGAIVAVNEDARTLTVQSGERERTFRVTEVTKIWLDRSRLQQSTMDGDLTDLAAGLEAEVRSLGPDQPDVAYWVKVQLPGP